MTNRINSQLKPAMVKHRKKYSTFYLVILFVLGLLAGLVIERSTVDKSQDGILAECSTSESSKKTINVPCPSDMLNLKEASKLVQGSKKALELIEDRCRWIRSVGFFDTNDDGNDELLLVTTHAGCSSCHSQALYIISGDTLLFEKDDQDILVRSADKPHESNGFKIKAPTRHLGEGYCCPTEGVVTSYKFHEGQFVAYHSETEKYKEGKDFTSEPFLIEYSREYGIRTY